jgi:hypothetical protein
MKKILLLTLMLALALLSTSCKVNYEAYVTIVNGGDVPMDGAIDGVWERIPADGSVTWGIQLDDENEMVDVTAEARPVGYDGYDSVVIRLSGDRDVQTWLTGWYRVSAAQGVNKVESQVFSGKQDKGRIIRRNP